MINFLKIKLIVIRLLEPISVIRYFLTKPKMIWGYRNRVTKKFLPQVRISNSAYIGCPEKLNIGNNVFIGHYGIIDASQGLTIEEGCQIGFYCVLASHSSHYSIRLYGKDYGNSDMIGYVKGSVHIGKYTFVGAHSTIMPNTTIGKGSIVSAYSYVKGNFPDFSIIAGNPAKIVGDTRNLDEKYLKNHPELKPKYNSWAK
ncbi:acyltransferase [bacterium]|nr:acyltransferase [bacterium]